MKLEAWPVEPPGLGSVPFSSSTMSFQPCFARCQAMLLPTIPAPMITTPARSGSPAMRKSIPPRGPRRSSPPDVTGSGEVDDDGLELGQAVDREAAANPTQAAPAAARAAEREMRLPVVRSLVDVDPAGAGVLGEPETAPQVAGEDARQQAVRRAVDDVERLFDAPDRQDGCDRAERLLAPDRHVGRDAVEDGRLEEERAA